MFLGEVENGFGTVLGTMHLATEIMDCGSTVQGVSQAKGVCPLLRQGHRLLDPRQPLVRIAQQPEEMGVMAAARHPSILPIEQRRGTVLLEIIEREPLCQMRVCRSW